MGEAKKCLSDLLKGVYVPPFEEIRRKVLEIYNEPVPLQKGIRRRALVKYLIRIRKMDNYVNTHVFNEIEKLPRGDAIHKFYLELMKLGGVNNYEEIINDLMRRRYIVNKLTREYLEKVRMSFDVAEAKKMTREYVGRLLSVFRRSRHYLNALSRAIKELRSMPCIDMDLPKIVVAGMPQVGKSTFVRVVSTAKPEVSPFPFTTKEIIVGHRLINYQYVQIIDTPGILDRPFNKLNEIERRALTAIKYLTDALIFLIDPYEASYYPLESQINLLKNIITHLINSEKVVVAVNKVDVVSKERISFVVSRIREVFKGDIMVMSALKNYNVLNVLNRALSKISNELNQQHSESLTRK